MQKPKIGERIIGIFPFSYTVGGGHCFPQKTVYICKIKDFSMEEYNGHYPNRLIGENIDFTHIEENGKESHIYGTEYYYCHMIKYSEEMLEILNSCYDPYNQFKKLLEKMDIRND